MRKILNRSLVKIKRDYRVNVIHKMDYFKELEENLLLKKHINAVGNWLDACGLELLTIIIFLIIKNALLFIQKIMCLFIILI